MIKKILIALALTLPMCAMAQKFGTIDAETVIQGMPEFTEVQNKIAESSKTYEGEYTKLQDELKAIICMATFSAYHCTQNSTEIFRVEFAHGKPVWIFAYILIYLAQIAV